MENVQLIIMNNMNTGKDFLTFLTRESCFASRRFGLPRAFFDSAEVRTLSNQAARQRTGAACREMALFIFACSVFQRCSLRLFSNN